MNALASAALHGTPLPGFLNALAGPLDHYGVGAIALLLLLENIGVPVIPGELAMITGAIFAGTGRAGLNIVEVGVVSVAASIAGAQIGYVIGRFAGRELVLRYGRWVFVKPHHLDRAEAAVSRFGGIVVVIARFIVGLREANGIIAGLTQMRWLTFGWYNVLGACAWVATWVSIGYVAGDAIGTIYHDINRYALYVLIALAVLLAAYIIRRVVRQRRHQAAPVTEETQETQEDSVIQEEYGIEDVFETYEIHEVKEARNDSEAGGDGDGEAESDGEAEGRSEAENGGEHDGDGEAGGDGEAEGRSEDENGSEHDGDGEDESDGDGEAESDGETDGDSKDEGDSATRESP
ncbi:MAG TPA: VTT domain-containing protein [Streptosporangiaceae bacterium]